jgi:hypothetical protein
MSLIVQLRGLGGAVLLTEMAICPHRQRPAVGMAEPAREGRDVHARFDAAGGKEA